MAQFIYFESEEAADAWADHLFAAARERGEIQPPTTVQWSGYYPRNPWVVIEHDAAHDWTQDIALDTSAAAQT